MLTALTVRNVVLIDRLDLSFGEGLSVLSGETGAGKSILLDAFGLALGARGEAAMVGAAAERASVSASFEIDGGHPAQTILEDRALAGDDQLVLRRVVGGDGRSRAFVNDQPVSVGLLRELGDSLVEIHGQFDARGLIERRVHRAALDAFGGFGGKVDSVGKAHRAWRAATEALEAARAEAASASADEALLRHDVEELSQLAPEPGEEAALAESRSILLNAEQLIEAMNGAVTELSGDSGAEHRLRVAHRLLDTVASKAGTRLDPALAALERARLEAEDALHELHAATEGIDAAGERLQSVEDRLFALLDAARKHGVAVDDLPGVAETLERRLGLIDESGATLADLERDADAAREAYETTAQNLSAARAKAAKRLDRVVTKELTPLKLEKARFETAIERVSEADWAEHGIDRIEFRVATNPGSAPGPLAKIASGGELSRFMLALKLALAEVGAAPTLVFDEVDAGVGGATADAVGERLARLGGRYQVLVVTHSPQVAARGDDHLKVAKLNDKKAATTIVDRLDDAGRREEVARMLSGRTVTDEARGAADRLMRGSAE